MTAVPPIKVMIVDDHPLVRIGMTTVINQRTDMTVVAESDDGRFALELFRRHRPDVVLMDLRMRREGGIPATGAILGEFPQARVLVISNYDGDEDIRRALEVGAAGYLFKSAVEKELVDAIHEVCAGRRYVPRNVAARLAEHEAESRLTRREENILELLGKGLNNREIGQVLGITEETAKTHLKHLFRKLEVSDRTEAVREAIRRGFLHMQ